MVRCGHCGRMWQATTYSGRVHKETGKRDRYSCYRCPNLFPRKYGEGVEKCASKSIRSDKLDTFVWQLIMDTLSDPDDYLERLNQKSGNLTEEISDASELIQKQILLKDRELEKVKIMFKRDIIDEDEMASEYQKINYTVKQLEEEYQKYRMQIQQFTEQKLNADRIKEISKRVQDFVNNGGNILSLEQKQYIIQSFIDEIIIQFDGDQVQVTAMGVLDEFKTEQFIRTASSDISSCTQPQEVE
jgi:site-specific DNA recombinase